jgi:hypothetical protein
MRNAECGMRIADKGSVIAESAEKRAKTKKPLTLSPEH